MAEVVPFRLGGKAVDPGRKARRWTVAACLRDARGAKLREVVVIGVDRDGYSFIGSAPSEAANTVLLIELAKHEILNTISAGDE